jgi:hypothetical protein
MFSIRAFVGLLMAACLPVLATASTTEQIQNASAKGAVAFVLVTDAGAAGVDQARQLIQGVMLQVPGSIMIESNRNDAADADFIKKYGLASISVPLILVFGSNGAIAGGSIASGLDSRKLLSLVPSPKKEELLMAIQSGQAAYITASRPRMASKADVTKGCAAACAQLMGRSTAIEINMDDPTESDFLKQLRINPQSNEPVTVVINAKGQITGTFTGVVEVENLIATATRVASSGCCPSGSGTSCAPTTKKTGGK